MLYRTRAGMDAWPKPKGPSLPFPLMAGVGVAAAVLAIVGGGAWWWMHRAARLQTAAQNALPSPPAQPVAQQSVPQTPPAAVQPPPDAAPAPLAAPADQVLTNDSIIQMVDAKVAPAVILSQIRNSKTAFTLSATEVIRLSKAQVPETVIEAMRNPKAAPAKSAAVAPASKSSAPAPAPTSAATTPSTAVPAAAPAPAPAAAATTPAPVPASGSVVAVTLTDGIPFTITLADDVPQNAEEGRPLRFTVANDVRVGDLVVIAKGAAVTGAIAQPERKGRLGIGGSKMTLRLIAVDAVDGHKYRVRAQSAKGADKNERQVEPSVKPKNKDLIATAGTEYIAYIEGDATVSVKK
jgi:hypothetical protein